MTSSASIRNPTSVHDSNAGHDFHVLWATRRLIDLLNPSSTLTALKMEGVAAEDLTLLSATEDHFLAADLTEYHGGRHFGEANIIEIVQLKYSTRHPNKAWTKGRLRARKSYNNSVIERLAAAYQDLVKAGIPRSEIQHKTRIRLISNQPRHPKLEDFLQSTRAAFQTIGPGQINLTQLRNALPTKHHKELNKLFERVGFSEEQFTDFFRVLDLSGCGTLDRHGQHLAVLQELAPSVPTGVKDVFLRLTNLIRQQALPENQNSAPLTQADVLAELQVFSEKDLFPEPASFNFPKNPVPTSEASKIATLLLQNRNLHYIVHGSAGVGKTTTVQQVQEHLPKGSVTILYDCYADGDYYSLRTGRHTLEHALLQLSNELAIATGLPFLVTTPSSKYKLLDYFEQRLNAAAQIVAAAGGLLVLVIDAADNSVVRSYTDSKTECFVPFLWELTLPNNCRLLMTCRTHRKESLKAPSKTDEIELLGFDEPASEIRLRQVFPTASLSSAIAFHTRTGGNPRVQEYWLDPGSNKSGTYAAYLHSFRRKPTTAQEIIEDIVKSAVVEVQNPEKAQDQLATLVCLQRPIPITIFAQASNITLETATEFCHALKPGLLLEDGHIGFRDEDFETQLRVRPDTEKRIHTTHEKLAKHFLSIASTNEYAAYAVAEHFFASNQHSNLIDLALSGPSVQFIPDSGLRLRIERRRLKLAMNATATLGEDIVGAKIAILAAESLRANTAIKSLINADIELAAQFSDVGNVADYFQDSTDNTWLGSIHYRLAAHYARNPTQHAVAIRHLEHASAWIRRWMRIPKHERQRSHVGHLEVACEIEAFYWLQNPVNAYERLQKWRPARIQLKALHTLIVRLSTSVPQADLEAQLRQLDLPLLGQCNAQASLWSLGYPVSKEWCEATHNRLIPLLRHKKIKPVIDSWHYSDEVTGFEAWPLHLAELFTYQRLDPEAAILLITNLLPAFPKHSISNYSTYAELVTPIRVACLNAYLLGKSITGSDLFPPPIPKVGQPSHYNQGYSYEEEEYRKNLDSFISIYTCRTQLLNTALEMANVEQIINTGLQGLYLYSKSSNISYSRFYQTQWLRSAASLASSLTQAEALLQQIADQAQKFVGRYKARQLWIHIAQVCIKNSEYRSLAFQCLERTALDAEEDDIPLNDRWSVLLQCAQTSLCFDEGLSRDFYRRAIETAHNGIGDDVAYRIKVGAEVANQLGSAIPAEEGYAIGNLLSALTEAYQPYVTEEETYMPLDDILKAVTKLHPLVGVALCLRWDISNIKPLNDSILSVVDATTDINYWHPSQSLWLLKLCGESYDISEFALDQLDKLPESPAGYRNKLAGLLDAVATWVAKDVPINRRLSTLKRIVAWAEVKQLSHLTSIKKIQQTSGFVESEVSPAPSSQHSELSEYETIKQKLLIEWNAAAIRGDINSFANWIDQYPYYHEELLTAIVKLSQRISHSQRVDILELIAKFRNLYSNPNNPSLVALDKLLCDWRRYGPVQSWAENELSRYFAQNAIRLIGERDWPSHLEQFCNLPFSGSSRATLILPGVADALDSLSPEHLCRAAIALTKTSETPALKEFINWHLCRMQSQLKEDNKTLPFNELISKADLSFPNPIDLYANFIWTVCGHPDKRVRWRVIHAARLFLGMAENASFRKDFLNELLRLSFSTSNLLPTEVEFYWQGARVWTLVLLDRIADEHPAELHPHLHIIKQHAYAPSFPHAQIRELARRILLKIHEKTPTLFVDSELEQIRFINRPKQCLVQRDYWANAPEIRPAIQFKKEFDFDELDTVKYWFGPLARVFGQSENKIAALVESWICEKWSRTYTECKSHWVNHSDRYDWRLIRHYKLDDTTVDTLEMHLTHHALMCVAGELADNYPMRVESYSDPISSWEDWLERYLPSCGSHTWLNDWRSPSPLRTECWGKLPNPWRRRPFKQYYEALGVFEPNRSGWIVIYGDHKFGVDEQYGDVYVSCVQVNPETSLSLLWALQAVEKNDYAFPNFGLDDSDHQVPDELPTAFTLKPLLREVTKSHSEGLEQHDTSIRSVQRSYPLLSNDFVLCCSLREMYDGKQYYDTEGSLAAEYEIWDDDMRDRHRAYDREAFSKGYRLWVRWDILLQYLTHTRHNLLFQVTLSRNYSSRNQSNKRDYDLGKRRLALLRPDGSFETVAGSCPPRPADYS